MRAANAMRVPKAIVGLPVLGSELGCPGRLDHQNASLYTPKMLLAS